MSEERKKPGVAFWTVVVLSLPMLYVLSFGPACWAVSHSNAGSRILLVAYRPIMLCMSQSERIAETASSYSRLGAAKGWMWIEGIHAGDWTWDWYDENDPYSPKARAIMRSLGTE